MKKLRTGRFPIKEYKRIKLVTQLFLHLFRDTKACLHRNLTYEFKMVGVGKLLKQAQKMQQKMEEAQASLSEEILEVSGGGGAVSIKISGMGEFKDLKLDADFLKEDPEFVSEAILQAIVDASEQAKKKNDDAMSGLTGGMQMPGLF